MKKAFTALLVMGVFFLLGSASVQAKTYLIELPSASAPTTPGTETDLTIDGKAAIDKPSNRGTSWSYQLETDVTSGTTTEAGAPDSTTYVLTFYFSNNAASGGSPYAKASTAFSGTTPYLVPITIPPCDYLRATLTSGVSGIQTFKAYLKSLVE